MSESVIEINNPYLFNCIFDKDPTELRKFQYSESIEGEVHLFTNFGYLLS